MAKTPKNTAPAASAAVDPAAGAIILRGIDPAILAGLASDGAMLTQAEGQQIVAAGLATVDTNKVEGDKAFVSLTTAGFEAIAELDDQNYTQAQGQTPVTEATTAPAKPVFEVEDGIPMPTKRAPRSGSSVYPIETMEVNQSFHIPVTPDNPDPATRIASSLSNARIKFAQKTGEFEAVTRNVYQKDENGKFVVVDGKRVVLGTENVQREKTINTRDWSVATVGAEDPKGPGARVWRTK